MASSFPSFDLRRFEALLGAAGARRQWPLSGLSYRPETDSTNDDALAAARSGAENGTLFIADAQRRGRGRHGRRWQADAGAALLVSWLLRPDAGQALEPSLTLAVGLGVRAALGPLVLTAPRVKWPNDVLIGDRKVAGVLCEAQLLGQRASAWVIGMGINCFEAPPDDETTRATSIAEHWRASGGGSASGQASGADARSNAPRPAGAAPTLDKERLLVSVLTEVGQRVAAWRQAGARAVVPEFAKHDALRGQPVSVDSGGANRVEGIAQGLNERGQLQVLTESGLVSVGAGTLHWRR